MRSTVTAVVTGASPADVFAQVESLDTYPAWLRLVHRVEPAEPEGGQPAWQVELRARVGPFARSKRLRMVRTVFEPGRRVRFERVQDDDRDHAEWILVAEVAPDPDGTLLTMDLEYTGELWGDSLLQPLLDEEVRRGKRALQEVVSAGTAEAATAPLELQRQSEAVAQRLGVEHLLDRSRGEDAPRLEQRHVGHRHRDVLDVVADQDERQRVRAAGDAVEGGDELLPPGEVQAGRRLVEQQDRRVVGQRSGQQHPLTLTGREGSERPVGERRHAHPFECPERGLVVGGVVPVPPGFEGGESSRAHHVDRRQLRAQAVDEGGREEPDPPAKSADVDPPEALAEHLDRARRRVVPAAGDADQRGLSAAVGAEHEPALLGTDLQRHAGEGEHRSVAYRTSRMTSGAGTSRCYQVTKL